MKKKSYIVEDLEDDTHEKIKEFVNLITDHERIHGENMKKRQAIFRMLSPIASFG
jgi:hypothetical protein